MYYVISDNGIISGKSIKEINRKSKSIFDENEFKACGADKVVKVTNEDIDFVQDKKRLSLIPIKQLYKSDNVNNLLYIIMVMVFIAIVT